MNTKLHAVTDAEGRPIRFFMTAGQVSDYTGAAGQFTKGRVAAGPLSWFAGKP
jgi:transposase